MTLLGRIVGGVLMVAGMFTLALFAGIVPDAEISAVATGLKSPLEFLVDPIAFEKVSETFDRVEPAPRLSLP